MSHLLHYVAPHAHTDASNVIMGHTSTAHGHTVEAAWCQGCGDELTAARVA